MTTILITGAGGVVGSVVSNYFVRADPSCVLVTRTSLGAEAGPSVVECDLESPSATENLIGRVEPQIVLHLAGNKNVFALEKDPELAWRANVQTTKNLIRALRGSSSYIVYLSTDYVFEGIAGPYDESSATRPTTEYGKSKLAAERCLLDSGFPVAIARSSALFGYPGDFVDLVHESLLARKPFPAFSDLTSNPTSIEDLIAMVSRLMHSRLTGIFHACGSEAMSREAFARAIASAFGHDPSFVHGEKRNERIRPADLALSNQRTCLALGHHPVPLRRALEARAQHRQGTFQEIEGTHGSGAST
jgi:dTDP-4-dehydrorhamnose reductase